MDPPDELEELRGHGELHRVSIPAPDLPPDLGLKLRQLQALLAEDPEFRTRHPEAYRVLFAPPHPNSKRDTEGYTCRPSNATSPAAPPRPARRRSGGARRRTCTPRRLSSLNSQDRLVP